LVVVGKTTVRGRRRIPIKDFSVCGFGVLSARFILDRPSRTTMRLKQASVGYQCAERVLGFFAAHLDAG
jgi:hypothetical protein